MAANENDYNLQAAKKAFKDFCKNLTPPPVSKRQRIYEKFNGFFSTPDQVGQRMRLSDLYQMDPKKYIPTSIDEANTPKELRGLAKGIDNLITFNYIKSENQFSATALIENTLNRNPLTFRGLKSS